MQISFQNLDTQDDLKVWTLNPSQEKFWTSKGKVVLFSGGFGCGKSLMLILKAIDLALRYPGNFILMGRKTYVELKDTLLKEFIVICPADLIASYSKAEMRVTLVNKSEIIFRHLDKIAENEIRSMNLGAAFIDQAEDLDRNVLLAIKGRLRREGIEDGDRKIYLTMNPELTWHFADFKQNPQPGYDLIEASTLENEDNLPVEYIKDLMSYPESWRRQYVEGVWDESLLSENTVFSREYLEKLRIGIREPQRTYEGLKIWEKFISGHLYQMGIDVAEGSEEETEKKDKSSITIVDLTVEQEVAHWSGQVPPDAVAEKAVTFARLYQNAKSQPCVIVPEMNSIGTALVNKLNQYDDIYIYRREEFDKSVGKRLKKLGFRTNRESKVLLVNHFQELLRKRNPIIRNAQTLEEFKTFIYSDEARKKGMAAKTGFHDDRVMSCLLAFFQKGEVVPAKVLSRNLNSNRINVEVQPTIIIKDGKARFSGLKPLLEGVRTWKTI